MDLTNRDRWQQVPRLFAQAVELTASERDAFVESVSTHDPMLRAELERLLRAHDDAGADFLQPIDPVHAAALLATPEEDAPERIGHYAIVRRIGSGGMGVVYLAHDTRLNRQVALKLLRRGDADGNDASRRLLTEAQAASALDHPYTVPVHEVGETADGRGYIVMAYAGDTSLADRLRRGPLAISEATELARQLAEALAAAHRLGIVHRDVKPSNVILSPEGRARLVDFGIAWTIGGNARNAFAAGTLPYMSPEQTRGGTVDHRSDVWSLGVVLYEMLAGRRPFHAPDERRVIHAIRQDTPPPLRSVRPEVPESLAALVDRCLSKSPDARPAEAQSVAAALTALNAATRTDAAPSTHRRRRALLLAAALVVPAAAALVAMLTRPGVDADPGTLIVLPFTAVTGDTALQRLGRELVVTLSSNLDVAAGMHVIAPLSVLSQIDSPADLAAAAQMARRLGAQRLIHGQLTRVNDDAIRLDAAVYAVDDLRLQGRAAAIGSVRDVAALTDSATLKLLLAAWPDRDWPLPNVAALTTSSVPALRAYLEGEMALAGARFRAAPLAFARAIAADSTFWFAYWRYMYARSYHGLAVDSVIRAAVIAHRASLPEPDRMMVEVLLRDSQSERLALRRAITDRFPTYWPAWFDLADQLTHHGVFLGHSFEEARAALERTLALNPRFVPAWEHLFWLSVHDRDTVRSGHVLRRLRELGGDSLLQGEWDLQTLDYYRYLDRLGRNGGAPIAEEATIGATVLAGYRGPLAPERLAVTFTNYGFFAAQLDLSRRVRARAPPSAISNAHDWGEALAWAGRGNWDSAAVALRRYSRATSHPRGPVWSYGLAVIGAWLGALESERPLALRDAALRSPFAHADAGRVELMWLDGLLACARGDTAGLDNARVMLQAADGAAAALLARSLDALANPRSMTALTPLLEQQRAAQDGTWVFRHGAEHPFVTGVDRLHAARALLAAGDTMNAIPLLRLHETELPGTLQPLPAIHQVLATATLVELARIAEARGESQRARHYRTLVAERTAAATAASITIPASCTSR